MVLVLVAVEGKEVHTVNKQWYYLRNTGREGSTERFLKRSFLRSDTYFFVSTCGGTWYVVHIV